MVDAYVIPAAADVARAAAALRRGELVVFPTETVYGLGANALDPVAVARIFAAKGRPPDNPLIVHVQDVVAARSIAASWPTLAERLSRRFWPGPLTFVLPRAPRVPDVVTAGLDTVAVRVPSHPVAAALLREAGLPVAAPSANRSGAPSATRVEDARDDLGASVAEYLDGGPTPIGVESTVVDLTADRPLLLRPGAVPREDIEAISGPLGPPPKDVARSPGLRHRHYAPRARLLISRLGEAEDQAARMRQDGRRVAVVRAGPASRQGDERRPGVDAEAWARALYSLLRDLDREAYDAVVVEEIPSHGLGEAVLDRLRRAAQAGDVR